MSLSTDLKVAVRALRQTPGATAIAILVLGLGIGANSTMLSLVNALILRPLPVHEPDQLSLVLQHDTEEQNYGSVSYPNFDDLRSNTRLFDGLTAHNLGLVGIGEGSTTRRAFTDIVASNYFETFGVQPVVGRFFTPEEERPGALIPVVVLGHNLYKRMGGTKDVLGTEIRVNGHLLTVVGVAPPGFAGTSALIAPETFVPLGIYPWMGSLSNDADRTLADRANDQFLLIGRRASGVTADEADADLARVSRILAEEYPAENRDLVYEAHAPSRINISTSPSSNDGSGALSALLMGMAFVVLLVAGLNLATVQGARVLARRRELAVRLALGSGRSRLVRQLVVECLLVALGGAVLGLVMASVFPGLISASISQIGPVDVLLSGELDWRIIGGTLGFALMASLFVGLAPALRASRGDLVTDLKDGGDRSPSAAPSSKKFSIKSRLLANGDVPVVFELALAMVLLVSAGLFVKAALGSTRIDPGFDVQSNALLEIDPSLIGYDEIQGRQVAERLRERIGALPQVEQASIAITVPFGIVSMGATVQDAELPDTGDGGRTDFGASYNAVTGNYFETLQIPLLQGRSFREIEPNPVVILDESLARALWPAGDAIGRRIDFGEGGRTEGEAEVIGVVGETRDSVFFGDSATRRVYVPQQSADYMANMHVHMKVTGDAGDPTFLQDVRNTVTGVDALLPVLNLRSFQQHLDGSFEVWTLRTGGQLFATFAVIALFIALAGVYGVRAYSVARRTREIGLRMALGATVKDTITMILREGGRVALLGVTIGLLLSLGVAQLLKSFLFGIDTFDPTVFAGAAGLLLAVAMVACLLPARRASTLDPLVALRED